MKLPLTILGFRLPSRLEWLFSVKAFIASMLALYIALKLQLPRPYWAMASVYVVSNPFVGATRSKAVYRAVGTAIGAVAAVILLPPFVEQPLLFSAIVAVWSGLLLFASMHDRTARGYVLLLAGYSMPLVALGCVDSPDTIFDVAVSRTEEITVGIMCASVVGSLLFPVKLSSSLADRTSTWFADAARFASACVIRDAAAGNLPDIRQRIVSSSNALEFSVSQLSYDHAQPAVIKQAQRLVARMQLFVVIGSALVDALDSWNGLARPELSADDEVQAAELEATLATVSKHLQRKVRQEHERNALRIQLRGLRSKYLDSARLEDARLANIYRRLRQFVEVWNDCLTLEETLRTGKTRWHGTLRHWRVGFARPYRDRWMLAFSALSVVVGIYVACLLWIYSGWTDGSLGVTLAVVACCFFATHDDPGFQIKQYFWAVSSSIFIAGIYVVVVVPNVQDFAMLIVAFAAPFVLLGTVIPRPKYATATMLTAVNTATFLSIQGVYDVNFQTFLNSNIAGAVGLLFALIWTRLTKPFGAEYVVMRHTTNSWADIARACSSKPLANQRVFAASVLDRLMQSIQRQGSKGEHANHASSQSLRDARIAFSVLDLRRLRRRLPAPSWARTELVLSGLEDYFRACVKKRSRQPVPATLLTTIDNAIRAALSPIQVETTEAIQSNAGSGARLRDDVATYLTDVRTALSQTELEASK